MIAVSKSRILSALLLIGMLVPLTDVRPADAPLRKSLGIPSPRNQFIPPPEPHLSSRQEIFQAIQEGLARRGVRERQQLHPGDLNIQASVPVFKVDKGLTLRRITFDPIRRVTVFELWASRQPQFLPFEVTTRRTPQALGLTSGLDRMPPEAVVGPRVAGQGRGQGATPAHSHAPILAKAGTPATLVMWGQNVRITTTVVPLQPGVKGQTILVRDATTARVMTAEVVDEGLLQTRF